MPGMIKLVEGLAASDKTLKGLAVTVTFREGESVQTEFYRVKDALLDWRRSHGEACAALELEYQADESSWPQIEEFWVTKTTTDRLIRSLFESLGNVDLCLVTPTGSNIKRIGFEVGRSK
jgi:hypothetical protein